MQDLFSPKQGDIFDAMKPANALASALLDNRFWFIQHETDTDDETGEPLTWSNDDGWGTGAATIFTETEKRAPGHIPLGGVWKPACRPMKV